MVMTAQEEALALDPGTAEALGAIVDGAKAAGWLQVDLKRYFDAKGIAAPEFKAALRCEPISAEMRSALNGLSVYGLPDMPHEPNPEQMRRHIEWLIGPARGDYDDALFEIAYSDRSTAIHGARLFGLDEVDAAVEFAVTKNKEWRNVYIGAALRTPDAPRHHRASSEHFYVATAVPIDIDSDYDATRARMAAVCDDGLVVATGWTPDRRSQHWARLDTPCDDDLDFGHAFAALVMHTGADQKVKDAARVLRLGGSVSFPHDPKKRAAGYCTELTKATVNEGAAPVSIERLKRLEPNIEIGRRFDAKGRPANSDIERDESGRVVDGREAHFRNLLLKHIRLFQGATGADPTENELWEGAFEEFCDPTKVDNDDGRWTQADGQKQLRARTRNTLRRFQYGRLARAGLASIDTGEGAEEAARVRANREATRRGHSGPPGAVAAALEGRVSERSEVSPGPAENTATAEVSPEPSANLPEVSARDASTLFDPWERFLVPAFPLDALPPVLHGFVSYLAQSVGGDPAAAAMAALATCSGALDQQFSVKLKRTGFWRVPPRLWVALVGDPSSKKSPIMTGCLRPLQALQAQAAKAYQADYAIYKAAKADGEPEPKPFIRHILNDATPEAIGTILAQQDRGALTVQDEMSGWLGRMDKYGGGGKGGAADRAFWLTAYNGGPLSIDRISRNSIVVNNLCLAFLGGIQPERLAEMADLTTDGMMQRFLPVMMQSATYSAEVHEETPDIRYGSLINALVRLPPHGVLPDEGAYEAFAAFERYLHDLSTVEGLGRGFTSFVGKLAGVHGSLALVLHLVSGHDPNEQRCDPIPEATVRAAERIIREFILPHGLVFYQSTTDGPGWEDLRGIASFVLTSTKDRFTQSDFTSGVRSLRGRSVVDVARALSPLVAGGWLFEDSSSVPAKAWVVKPGLRPALAERREIELARKAELLRALRGFGQEIPE